MVIVATQPPGAHLDLDCLTTPWLVPPPRASLLRYPLAPFSPFPSFSPTSLLRHTHMAVATQHSAKATSRHVPHSHPDPAQPRASRQRFVVDFSQCLFEFVVQLLPTVEELAVKEDVRKLLERLIRTIEPDSRLLSFGSTANGFSLRNSGKLRTSPRPPAWMLPPD